MAIGLKVDGADDLLAGFQEAVTYASLHIADPVSTNEVAGDTYARVAIPANGWTRDTNGTTRRIRNTAVVAFPTPAADWADATHYAIWDASTGGNMLFSGQFSNDPSAPGAGDTVEIAPLGISFALTITT